MIKAIVEATAEPAGATAADVDAAAAGADGVAAPWANAGAVTAVCASGAVTAEGAADATGSGLPASAVGDRPYACSICATQACLRGEIERMPTTCPTRTASAIARDARPYLDDATHREMLVADAAPFDESGRLRNRVEELVFFAREMGMRRIGVAYCVSMTKEAQRLGRILRESGLEAELVCCRVGAIDYDEVGLRKAHPGRFAATCNPVAQARLLDAKEVDLVAMMGLCIGHDLILQRESKAPVTTLVVKDRALDHRPIAALRG